METTENHFQQKPDVRKCQSCYDPSRFFYFHAVIDASTCFKAVFLYTWSNICCLGIPLVMPPYRKSCMVKRNQELLRVVTVIDSHLTYSHQLWAGTNFGESFCYLYSNSSQFSCIHSLVPLVLILPPYQTNFGFPSLSNSLPHLTRAQYFAHIKWKW